MKVMKAQVATEFLVIVSFALVNRVFTSTPFARSSLVLTPATGSLLLLLSDLIVPTNVSFIGR